MDQLDYINWTTNQIVLNAKTVFNLRQFFGEAIKNKIYFSI